GHAWRGAFDAGLIQNTYLFNAIDAAIYAWHMPLFFFLSGLIALDVLQRTALLRFLGGRVRRLLWPLALWTWVFFGVKLLAGQAANHPVSMSQFPLIPLPPYEHLWFLWALLLAQMCVLGLWLGLRRLLDARQMRVVFAGLALGLCVLVPFVYVPSPLFGAAVQHFPYFAAGIAMSGMRTVRPPLWLAVLAGAGVAVLLGGGPFNWTSMLVSLVLVVLISTVVAHVDANRERPPTGIALLRLLGQYSMAIFLAHTIFSAAFRIGLLAVGVDGLAPHLITAVVVGILGPILLVHFSRLMRVEKLLGF
ncbi:MAG: acyltransferase family protein, partial [Pseudomonadota bacterium]